jgi:hypothetical protein
LNPIAIVQVAFDFWQGSMRPGIDPIWLNNKLFGSI